jgi:uncharacterized protein YneF (UPF0154 family)
MNVGVLLVVLGLVSAGLIADFLVENELMSAPADSFALFGATFELSRPELVLIAAILGVLAVVLVMLGAGLLRGSWGRRRALKRRLADLERENAEMMSREHLAAEVRPTREPDPPAG